MTRNTARASDRTQANFGFSALVFALSGWVNFGALLIATNASHKAYLMSTGLGILIAIIAYRRCGAWQGPPERGSTVPGRSTLSLIGSCLTLVGVGWTLAYSMMSGFVTPSIICTAVLCFFPWNRITFCRQHFFVSQVLVIVGWIPFFVTPARHQVPFMSLACTYFIWALAAGLALITLSKQRSSDRSDQKQVERKAYERV